MTYRNRALLNLAHAMPCQAQFKHVCSGYQGCEPAHSDHHIFGRGGWHKSHDFAFAAMCHNAHAMITGKPFDENERDQKFFDWLRAYVSTQEYLWRERKLKVVAV